MMSPVLLRNSSSFRDLELLLCLAASLLVLCIESLPALSILGLRRMFSLEMSDVSLPLIQTRTMGWWKGFSYPKSVRRFTGCRESPCGAEDYESQLTAVFGAALPRFDLVLLGLGQDGHTASLFPGDSVLRESSRRVAVVYRPDHSRLTLTLPVLSAARMAMFLVAGANKAKALKWLLDGEDIPAARVEADDVVIIADSLAVGKAEPRF